MSAPGPRVAWFNCRVSQGSVIGVGYEGLDAETFIGRLRLRGVQHVVDVRLTPLSRKRGFSKVRLSEALAGAGIKYTHLRALGNPKENRAGFSDTTTDVGRGSRAAYAEVLRSTAAQAALDTIRRFAQEGDVAVLCFEAEECFCHRELVLRALRSPALAAA